MRAVAELSLLQGTERISRWGVCSSVCRWKNQTYRHSTVVYTLIR